jgi:hypothetical protein
MKKIILLFAALIGFAFTSMAQTHTKKDGTPEMRYKENNETYGTTKTETYKAPTYETPKETKSNDTYNTYPNKQDGTPDMRYKENKELYGTKPNK